MYLQDIVISPDVFEELKKALKNFDFDMRSYLANLKFQKRLVVDSSGLLLSEIIEIIESADDSSKRGLTMILDAFRNSGRIHKADVSKINEFNNSLRANQLLALGSLSNSKIINSDSKKIFSEIKKLKSSSQNKLEFSEIEVLNSNDFSDPPETSKLLANKKHIRFKEDDTFNFEQYFLPYLIDAKKITFTDNYIRYSQSAIKNLERIIKICKNLQVLEINTSLWPKKKPEDFEMSKYEIELRLKSINKSLQVLIKQNKKGKHHRTLLTDKHEFRIDPGFDFVDENYKVTREICTIDISPINK